MKRRHLRLMFVFAAVFSLFMAGCAKKPETPAKAEGKVVKMALLVDSGATHGPEVTAAAKFAIRNVSREMTLDVRDISIDLEVMDTHGLASDAYLALKDLKFREYDGLVGPGTDDEIAAVKGIVNKLGIVTFCYGGGSIAHGTEADRIYRVNPSVDHVGTMLSQVLRKEGSENAVCLVSEDYYDESAFKFFSENFTDEEGLNVYKVSLDSPSPLEEASRAVERYMEQDGEDSVSVIAFCGDRIRDVMHGATGHAPLSRVRWYGTDNNVMDSRLSSSERAAAFASKVGFKAPQSAFFPVNEECKALFGHVKKVTGKTPTYRSAYAYDATYALAKALVMTVDEKYPSKRQKRLEAVCAGMPGTTGFLDLNSDGDRAVGYYSMYTLRKGSSGYYWQRLYNLATTDIGAVVVEEYPTR
ncbi:MAG: hypothetical protein U5N86_10170 [Planctomycetota bacterium]|nr:hypothetical protein [Planctomycetota bacterium]